MGVYRIKKIISVFFLHFIVSVSFAQSGHIRGIIIDNNGIPIPGATVHIERLAKATVSGLDGRFTLFDIPLGGHTLKIKYLGFSHFEQEVNIVGKQTISVSVVLRPEIIRLKGVEVIKYVSPGQTRALNTQKSNVNITNVISTDQIGKFPDANIGDAVKRIPGITIQIDQGEARDVIIRGLSPELNSVTLNGSRIPSAEGDNRNIQLDLIPSDMIQTIEVTKALTPDMDADALGGSINLVTRTSPQGFRVSATFGSGIGFITNKAIWNGSFLVGNRTKNDKFGWMLSASINDNQFGSDNIEAQWNDKFEYNTGEINSRGEPVLEELEVNPYTNILEQQTHIIQRVRRSFAANFDYSFNNNNSIFIKTLYNWRDDREKRFVFEQEVLEAQEIALGDFTITNGNVMRFPVLVSRQTRGGINNKRSENSRLEDQRMQNYSLAGNHLIGGVKINWMTSFAKASEERLNERIAEFKAQYIINNDNSNIRFPLFIPENPLDPNNLSAFEYDEIIEENKYTEEEDVNFFANAEIRTDFFRKGDGLVKFGVRGRLKSKLRNNNFQEFDLESDFPTLADAPNRDYSDSSFLVGSQYQAGRFADEEWLGNLNLQNGNIVPDEFLRQNFTVNENVMAAYVMANQKLSDKITALVGFRVEHTEFEAVANQIEEGVNAVDTATERESYLNFLPGLHFKYNLSEQTIFRFAWTNTLARPNYVDMIPTRDIIFSDREIILGNPKLNPATSMNFDLMGEHYFKTVGILSGGLFYKEITDFVYTFRTEAEDDSFGIGTAGFDVFQPLNGEGASLFGLEIAFKRKLDFFGGFAKNLNLGLNYTYLTSETKGIRTENGEVREDLDLPDTAPNVFNISLGYESNKFTAGLWANFSDSYLDEIGRRDFEDIYYDRQFFLDFNASYSIQKNLSIYITLNNITNQPLRLYQGVSARTIQAEYYDRRLTFGLKYDLFKK